MRVGLPVAVARKVTSPVNGLEPVIGGDRHDRPDGGVGRVGLEVVEDDGPRDRRAAADARLARRR